MPVDKIIKDITSNIANDGSVDSIQLIEQLTLVSRITETVLGIFVVLIVTLMPLVIALELSYINFPILQEKFEEVLVRTEGRLKSVLGLVLHDAKSAVKIAHTTEEGMSVNWIYLRIKIKVIFLSVFSVSLILGAGPYVLRVILVIAKSIIEGFRMVL